MGLEYKGDMGQWFASYAMGLEYKGNMANGFWRLPLL